MFIVDTWSRPNSQGRNEDEDIIQCSLVERYVACCIDKSLFDGVREIDLPETVKNDPVASECIQQVSEDWRCKGKNLTGDLAKLYSCRYKLSVYGGFTLDCFKIVHSMSVRSCLSPEMS